MLKNINSLGKTLNRKEQQNINGGDTGGGSDCGPSIPQQYCTWSHVCDDPNVHTFKLDLYYGVSGEFHTVDFPCSPS